MLDDGRRDVLLVRLTHTSTGAPLTLEEARSGTSAGKRLVPERIALLLVPAMEPGWFWMPVAPKSARSIRTYGFRLETEQRKPAPVTVWFPPQQLALDQESEPKGDADITPDGVAHFWI